MGIVTNVWASRDYDFRGDGRASCRIVVYMHNRFIALRYDDYVILVVAIIIFGVMNFLESKEYNELVGYSCPIHCDVDHSH